MTDRQNCRKQLNRQSSQTLRASATSFSSILSFQCDPTTRPHMAFIKRDTENVLSPGCQGQRNTEDYKSRWEGEEEAFLSSSPIDTHTHVLKVKPHKHAHFYLTCNFPPLCHHPISFKLSFSLCVCASLCDCLTWRVVSHRDIFNTETF